MVRGAAPPVDGCERPSRGVIRGLQARIGRLMRVQGESMTPGLRDGELVFVSAAYRSRPPRRAELAAFRPSGFGGRALVKRLIGLPNEQVEVDGRRWRLGTDEYFLLGDGAASCDSRHFGPVARASLIGPVRRIHSRETSLAFLTVFRVSLLQPIEHSDNAPPPAIEGGQPLHNLFLPSE